ncbi:VID27 domain-containing protein, partial [Cephalotus follicularis]
PTNPKERQIPSKSKNEQIQIPSLIFYFLSLNITMGGAHSREDLEISDSDSEEVEEDENYQDSKNETPDRSSSSLGNKSPSSLDEVESKLKALKLKYPSSSSTTTGTQNPSLKNAVKLYLHIGGNTPKAKWVVSEKLTTYSFLKTSKTNGRDDEADDEDDDDDEGGEAWWVLKVGVKIRVKVAAEMQLKTIGDQKRVDFVAQGVWALKFFSDEDYKGFVSKYQDCLFENTYGFESNEANKIKVYGKDFIGWVKPEAADDSMWEDADDSFLKSPGSGATPVRDNQDLREEFEEASNGGIQSLALGALDNSFLVGDSGIQVVKNFCHGVHGKGVFVNFDNGDYRSGSNLVHSTPKKALLMRAETNMLLMSPMNEGALHSTGLHQLDIETGKVVTEWKFEKDGTDITMRDITNDSKGGQLDPSGSTFLGLDDNRLCRWDMRDRKGMVQNLASASAPVLNWTQGHQFSRGTNFQCFATTGDGSIVVGSIDGKIRLYSSSSMRQAKTAFPGLGSPITHVDVTYDGKWILGTTDSYLILICTVFTDKDGKIKIGFNGRMGNRIAAPRLLKLTPLDSHLAGVNNKFRNAQFSWVTENGKQERHLVATVGKFSVIWNFQQVKNGSHECYRNQEGLKSCYCYKIVLKDDSIVDSRFMHDKFAVTDSPEAPLVIATPMKVSSFSISSRRLSLGLASTLRPAK